MSPRSRSPLPFLLVLFTPLLALAQEARGTGGGPLLWFWVVAIGVIMLLWVFRVLRKRGGPPPIDPTLRGPRNASR